MKRLCIIMAVFGLFCTSAADAKSPARFESTDSNLVSTYHWARDMALGYVRDGSDSVGLWYEAALPGRESFCMRDLSHQTVGAVLLGLDDYNLNMLAHIAANISESKDWCSYWEINRHNRPTPCDYANDKEFWYNLPANFDVMRACFNMYEWTGNDAYLINQPFVDFYRHTARDYADRWDLTPQGIMSRRRFMNTPEPFDRRNAFHTCRGLPSYAENFSGITVAIDLLGALKEGYDAYARINELNGEEALAEFGRKRAEAYSDLIENQWWDNANKRYNTYYKEDGTFHRGEGIPYLLLIGAIGQPDRQAAAVSDVLSRDWNVENLSAFPVFLYRLGYFDSAGRVLKALPKMPRNDYPEVSFGVIEGIFSGVMGIVPSASEGSLATCYRGDPDSSSTASDVPLFGGSVTVTHNGRRSSTLTNNTDRPLRWEASFVGDGELLESNGHTLSASVNTDAAGNPIVTASLIVKPGAVVTVSRQ